MSGLVTYLRLYVVGISLEACDCMLQIGYVDDVRFTWSPLEVWIVGWVLHLLLCYFRYGYFDNYKYM